MNQERPNERRAKEIVEKTLGVTLEHADKNGGVDYRSADGSIAVEVTRVTDEDVRQGLRAWSKSEGSAVSGPPLTTCWLVFTAETTPGLKTYRQRVHPLIARLEVAGLESFSDQRAGLHVLEGREHGDLFRDLLLLNVEHASAVPHTGDPDPAHVHRVFVTVGGGGSASGSDEAVVMLIDALAVKADNAQKLGGSGAENRHLFVWIDGATPFGIERALSHDTPSWDDDGDSGFGLPSLAPQLDPAVTHLWVVHERSGRGWLWDGQEWQAFEGL